MRWQCAAMRMAGVGLIVLAMGGVVAPVARAQEQATPEDMGRKYQDALEQLKAAQDRKNELATENEQLKARIAELEKQLDQHRREAAEYAQNTFFLRSHYAAWQTFVERYPQLRTRWRAFLERSLLEPGELPEMSELAPLSRVERWPREYEVAREEPAR